MSNDNIPCHYVCTPQRARELVSERDRFWVSNCGCREGGGGCARSRMDLCLVFNNEFGGSGSNLHEVDRSFVEGILREAEVKRLVARPFRGRDRTQTDGICFCCDDCCGYFLDPAERCDKGLLVEATAMDDCTHCGLCADVCHFHARRMEDRWLIVTLGNCFGCGVCADICPEYLIDMTRAPAAGV